MGATDALAAIAKLEGKKLYHDLHQFDVPGIVIGTDRNTGVEKEIVKGVFGCMNASDIVKELFADYYKKNIMENAENQKLLAYKPNTHKPKKKGQQND